jgi:heat-inducible transcriptional repressor
VEPLPRRQLEVLQATVRHYVDTMEPVGSNTLVRRFGLPASPATVRSAMGALEQRGLLTQPHVSAGRIPSERGYRAYVDRLLPAPGAAALQLERELTGISLQWLSLDDLLRHLGRRLSDLTGLLSLITRPQRPQPQLQAVRLIANHDRLLVFLVQGPAQSSSLNVRLPGELEAELPVLERWANEQLRSHRDSGILWQQLPRELHRSGHLLREAMASHALGGGTPPEQALAIGLTGLMTQPEFSHTASLRPLLELVEDNPQKVLGPQGDAIWIGSEHPHHALHHCAVVQARYGCGDGSHGHVALIGPMRMAYATARSAVQSVARILQRLLS